MDFVHYRTKFNSLR
jgi:hypothetical protein